MTLSAEKQSQLVLQNLEVDVKRVETIAQIKLPEFLAYQTKIELKLVFGTIRFVLIKFVAMPQLHIKLIRRATIF